MQPKTAQALAVIAVLCAMAGGLSYIVQQHAQEPESYPSFSSYRTLPEGTSVLYEALRRAPEMTADRNVQPLGALRVVDAAIVVAGIQPRSLNNNGQWFNDMEELAARGNRVIIGLLPHRTRFLQPQNDQLETSLKQWNIRLAFVRPNDVRNEEEPPLIAGWPMYFENANAWEIKRQEDGRAVVIERKQGKGSLVLMANSFLLSNAAMVDDRQTAFLAMLIGPARHAVFDETHFGIEESGSVAALARRYHLQGLVLGLAITALLFIWKSAAGFPPPLPQASREVLGEDTSSALLNLLRRNIARDDILSTCVQEWRKMFQRKATADLPHILDLAENGRRTPAPSYAQIQRILGAKHTRS